MHAPTREHVLTADPRVTSYSTGGAKWSATVMQSNADGCPARQLQRRASSTSPVRCRAMESAALPLGISLTLDQVDAQGACAPERP